MLSQLTPLDLITYRAALALRFTDSVTGADVTAGLRARAWAYDPADPQPARRVYEAEKSRHSGIYAFRSLPGLAGYQIGEYEAVGTLAFIIHVEDLLGRYLPQTRRYVLPLLQPAVQRVVLFPAPDRATPTGYASVRGQLQRATAPAGAPPQVTAIEPARWASVVLTVPPGNPGDPPAVFVGQTDGRGSVLIMPAYPLLAAGVLLNEANWTIAAAVAHQPASQDADYAALERVLPDLLPNERQRTHFPPFQATVQAQAAATLFGAVEVVDPLAQTYEIVGPTNDAELDFTLSFGRPLTLRTQVDGDPDHPLAVLLIRSA